MFIYTYTCIVFCTILQMPHRNIVLKESVNILSNGTTGLCTWQVMLMIMYYMQIC